MKEFRGQGVNTPIGCIPPFNEVLTGEGFYLSYAFDKDETAIVIPGEDGIGVMFIVLNGDFRNELADICNTRKFPLGECIRFATHKKNLIKQGSGTIAFPDFLTIK